MELALEMLSAHVLPNHPEVATLLGEAAELLEARTGSATMPGYQSGPERVDQVVEAIFGAIRARGIRYATPPASWADDGQKVRTPGEVLGTGPTAGAGASGGVGTCLDTVVVMAAALEQAGLHPLLWVVAGHAFLGYWREEETLGAPALTDVAEVINLIDLDLIRLVETTQVTDRTAGSPLTFAQAQRSPYLEWLTDLGTVIGVVDVVQARRTHILPLPARTVAGDGTVIVTEYRPADAAAVGTAAPAAGSTEATAAATSHDSATTLAPTTGTTGPATPPRITPPRITQWKNALLDLSLRNRLINFTARGALALTVPDQHLAGVEDLVNGGTGLTLLPADRMSTTDRERGIRFGRDLPVDQLAAVLADKHAVYADVTDAAYATKLRALAYKARTVVQETGANNLYLAFGSLVWTSNDRQLRSPLVLVPVVLEPAGRGGDYRVRLDEAGASTPNYCLLEKLRQQHGLSIPGLASPADDATGIDLAAAFRATREALLAAGLPYRVEETLDLSILQFAKFRLWKDLDENWASLAENSLVNHLVHTPTQPFVDPVPLPDTVDLDALGAECPVPGDSSQLAAVAEAVAERTFVLEGPPGTGKSQTITNLLTRAVYEGKKVLFVAEKRAALQVVQARLNEVGMGPFALDLHDKASKPAAVRAQIRQALEHNVSVDGQGLKNDLDVLGTARRSLARYTDRLHEQNSAGLSFYSARTAVLTADDDVRALPLPADLPARITADELTELRRLLRDLPDVTDPVRPRPQHPWAFVTAPPPAPLDLAAVARAAAALDEALAGLLSADATGPAAAVVATAASPSEFVTLSSLAGTDRVALATLDGTRTPAWMAAAAAAEQAAGAFVQAEHPALTLLAPGALGLDAAALHRDAQAADAAGYFGRRGRRKAVLARLTAELRPGAKLPLGSLSTVTGQLADSQAQLTSLRRAVRAVAGVSIADDWNPLEGAAQSNSAEQTGPDELAARVAWLRWAGGVVAPGHPELGADFVAALRDYLEDTPEPDVVLSAALDRAMLALQAVLTATGAGPAAVAGWAADGGLVAVWTRGAEERDAQAPGLPTLTKWVALLEHLEPLTRLGLTAAHTAVLRGEVDADDAGLALEKGLATASVTERGRATALGQFDAAAQNRSITRFTTASGAVRRHLPTFIPYSVLRRRTIGAVRSAADGATATASDTGAATADSAAAANTAARLGLLGRQLDRQRGGMGVRELMHEFGDLITDIMPCMLMSPESVARIFPARADLFDIVVFDEASQVRVSDAVGAMGRARSVVVVGDSKQMPPTSFAEAAIGSGEEDGDTLEFVRDEESILSECVQAQVPSKWLSWHYRSQDESLIAFSNRAYYRDRLSSFPAPHHGGGTEAPGDSAGYGVSLRRVDGEFLRSGTGKNLRTNPVEAKAIVAEIVARFAADPDGVPSIGVITFNVQQRALIEGSLRDSGDDRIMHALESERDGLFVKNLENVQGDERDTILFSTAFSADASGRLPLNFGPLNLPGGERRLNVAITRARRQVIVFSSFDPQDLRAEETISAGVKDLRAYLDLAAGGSDGLASPLRQSAALDRHREEIAEGLRERGFAVQTDVGLSDFRVDLSVATTGSPEHPVMAVLLDGPTWAARRTVSDRDGLPVEVLSRLMGWPAVERVWMPEWLGERDAVLDRLAEQLDALDAARQARESAALV
ncbi:DUF4011 domain-containing protein [Cryobacterium sp.]|uniref:DUF4011 domain-containing protein n=1 Tax=Cryobacterium sp. TaxID=1926290 RepID=UPI00262F86F9|nr:DUF4011 domain-containing protein [Cryobacterium sp.]MCU1446851.1 helicase [Cryobacterium sp.]